MGKHTEERYAIAKFYIHAINIQCDRARNYAARSDIAKKIEFRRRFGNEFPSSWKRASER